MKEEWRDIKGYEGRYQVSNLGRIKSLRDNNGNYRESFPLIFSDKSGYKRVNLYTRSRCKHFLVHRLVAMHFIDNPNNLPQVNHKDENKQNNCVENLEWCTPRYNICYGNRNKKVSNKLKVYKRTNSHSKHLKESHFRKCVICVTTGKKFNTIKEAAEYYYIDRHSISRCCRGIYKSAGKHPITGEKLVWRYL